jgi:hypothetical protein
MSESPYYTDPEVREKIDDILQKCARLMANVETKSKYDVGTTEKALKLEREWLQEVKQLDKEMYLSLVPHEEEEK